MIFRNGLDAARKRKISGKQYAFIPILVFKCVFDMRRNFQFLILYSVGVKWGNSVRDMSVMKLTGEKWNSRRKSVWVPLCLPRPGFKSGPPRCESWDYKPPDPWHDAYIYISLFLNINQLDALNFIISLFQASTCFEHKCSSWGGQNCITQSLVSSHWNKWVV